MIDFNRSGTETYDMIELSKTRKCVIYARCSTNYQEESIESQIAFNQAFAKQNGLEVVGIFQDEGKSGRDDNRDGLQALMKESTNPNKKWV